MAAGGIVQMNRVDGQLAMSRAIGDYLYKMETSISPRDQKVIPLPDITSETIYPGDVLLVCCDGIVEQLNNKQVADIVYRELPKHRDDPAEILSILFKKSIDSGSRDNHSALLILFENGLDYNPEDEFRPGPLTPYRSDKTFEKHYLEDAKKHGYEGELLMNMVKKAEKSMPTLDKVQNNPQRQLEAQRMLEQILSQNPGGNNNLRDKLRMLFPSCGHNPVEANSTNQPSANSTMNQPLEEKKPNELDTDKKANVIDSDVKEEDNGEVALEEKEDNQNLKAAEKEETKIKEDSDPKEDPKKKNKKKNW